MYSAGSTINRSLACSLVLPNSFDGPLYSPKATLEDSTNMGHPTRAYGKNGGKRRLANTEMVGDPDQDLDKWEPKVTSFLFIAISLSSPSHSLPDLAEMYTKGRG